MSYKYTVALARLLELFKYRRLDTPIHRLSPEPKFIYVIAASVTTLLAPSLTLALICFATSMCLLAVAKSLRRTLSVLWGAKFFILLIFLLNYVFAPAGMKLHYAMVYVMRIIALISAYSVIASTTVPEDIASLLVRLRVPDTIVTAFTMSIRLVPVVARDLMTILDAQRSRGLELEKGPLTERVRKLVAVLIPLLAVELERVDRIAEALESRAFGAVKRRTYAFLPEIKPVDVAAAIAFIAFYAVIATAYMTGYIPEVRVPPLDQYVFSYINKMLRFLQGM